MSEHVSRSIGIPRQLQQLEQLAGTGAPSERECGRRGRQPRCSRAGEPTERMTVLEGSGNAVPRSPISAPRGDVARDRADRVRVGASKPLITFTSVDLPAPFGPINPTTLASRAERHLLQRLHAGKDRETEAARRITSGRFRCLVGLGLGDHPLVDVRYDLRGDHADHLGFVVVDSDDADARPVTACSFFENITRPETVGTFVNFSSCAASATPLVEPARLIAVTTPSSAAGPVI